MRRLSERFATKFANKVPDAVVHNFHVFLHVFFSSEPLFASGTRMFPFARVVHSVDVSIEVEFGGEKFAAEFALVIAVNVVSALLMTLQAALHAEAFVAFVAFDVFDFVVDDFDVVFHVGNRGEDFFAEGASDLAVREGRDFGAPFSFTRFLFRGCCSIFSVYFFGVVFFSARNFRSDKCIHNKEIPLSKRTTMVRRWT